MDIELAKELKEYREKINKREKEIFKYDQKTFPAIDLMEHFYKEQLLEDLDINEEGASLWLRKKQS